jgi:hypothetical protein
MPSDRVRAILPGDTATTWDAIAPIVSQQAYLGGETAIAVHLGHRISRQREIVAARGRLPGCGLTTDWLCG